MPATQFSDDPVIVKAPRRLGWGALAGFVIAAAVVGAVVYAPVQAMVLDHRAHEARRGGMNGSIETITVDGVPHDLELAYVGTSLAAYVFPELPAGATVRIRGDFGDETLAWNPERRIYGPVQAQVEHRPHQHVRVRIQLDGRTLWSGGVWIHGNPDHEH